MGLYNICMQAAMIGYQKNETGSGSGTRILGTTQVVHRGAYLLSQARMSTITLRSKIND